MSCSSRATNPGEWREASPKLTNTMTHLLERSERERVRSQALLESRPGSINPDRDTGAQVDQPAGPAKNNTNKAKWERTGGCMFVSISRSAGKSFDPGAFGKLTSLLVASRERGRFWPRLDAENVGHIAQSIAS